MFKLAKLSSVALVVSFLVSPTGLLADPDFENLETRFPAYFRGFKRTPQEVQDLLGWLRNQSSADKETNGVRYAQPDSRLKPFFQQFASILETKENPVFEPLRQDLAEILADPKKQTAFAYMYSCMKAAALISEPTVAETDFFKAAGFEFPYAHIRNFAPDDDMIRAFVKGQERERETPGSFFRIQTHRFGDPDNQVGSFLEEHDPFRTNTPYFMLCPGPRDGIFGFFYLAWMYSKGMHPIPVTFEHQKGELHGLENMSPWGQMCHDQAHSQIDPTEHSVEQYVNNLGNKYLELLEEKWTELTPEEKRNYPIDKVLTPLTRFAAGVHQAYRESVVAILEASVSQIPAEATYLPPEVKAFAVAAFYLAHEAPEDLSDAYGTPVLADLLKKAAPEVPDTEERGDDLFHTAFVTGSSPLTDEEIVQKALEQPLNEFHIWGGDYKIDAERVSSSRVTRNPYFIDVEIRTFDGQQHVLRKPTHQGAYMNLEHDKAILRAARQVLGTRYSYKLPQVPDIRKFQDRESEFEAAVRECRKHLELGFEHLTHFYREKANELSHLPVVEGGEETIADHFSRRYEKALAELAPHMPSFVGDLREFVAPSATASVPEVSAEGGGGDAPASDAQELPITGSSSGEGGGASTSDE